MASSSSPKLPFPRVTIGVELRHQFAIVADLVVLVGEVAVPEDRELFFHGPFGDEHALGEVGGDAGDLDVIREAKIIAVVNERLPPHGARFLFHLDAIQLDLVGIAIMLRGPCQPDFRWAGRSRARGRCRKGRTRHAVVGGLLPADEMADCSLRSHLGELLDFVRCTAKAGALEQVRGAIVVPFRRLDGG